MAEIAVLLPGIMGSRLARPDGEEIWPGPVTSLYFKYASMEDLLSEDLVPTDCIRKYFITNQYVSLIEDLEKWGFHEANGTLKVFPYDWRRSNALSAQRLADLLDSIVAAHPPGSRISLLGHSMGGLVARYYLESGDFSGRPGMAAIKQLVTLGTPHRGAAVALAVVSGQERRLFLSADQAKRLSGDERYPSAYQLLPVRSEPFAWDHTPGAGYPPVDIYSDKVSSALGLSGANLKSALDFHSKLDAAKRPAHVRYFCFCGTRQSTATYSLLKNGKSAKVECDDGGDGTVPIWSSGLTGVQSVQVGGEHGTIYKNGDLRRVLGALLTDNALLAVYVGEVEVALRDHVVSPGATVPVVLSFGAGAAEIVGEVRVERVELDPATGMPLRVHPAASADRYAVRYDGLAARSFALEFVAPQTRGVYQVGFYHEGRAEPEGTDELIVQMS